VSELQRQTVHRHVQAAQQAGARCVLGGTLPKAGSKGTFYPPTVLADVPHLAEVTQEETFGPVVAISKFDGADETAVALANDSTYGLTASVYSGDVVRAGRVAARISAGQVGINNNPLSGARDIRCPFVGHKKSGYGSHSGQDGWRQFSVPKSLLYTSPPPVAALPMAPPPAQGPGAARDAAAGTFYLSVGILIGAAIAVVAARAVSK